MHPPAESVPDYRYPIGPPQLTEVSASARKAAVQDIAELPSKLSTALLGLAPSQLDTPYREGGWSLRQLTHHVADSHLNAYTRLRLALTEEWPVIKPYHQELWAELADARTAPIAHSLALLTSLHGRWITLLDSLDEAAWLRGYTHPENGRTALPAMTALYSWHGRHHTAHVLALRKRRGW